MTATPKSLPLSCCRTSLKASVARYVAATCTAVAASALTADAGPRDDLRAQLEQQIAEFCRDVHKAAPLILPEFIEERSSTNSGRPDLTFEYKNIRCEGVERPALKQCGFCGLTMEGMVCKVVTFTWRDGQYVEASSRIEPIFQ